MEGAYWVEPPQRAVARYEGLHKYAQNIRYDGKEHQRHKDGLLCNDISKLPSQHSRSILTGLK